MTRHRYGQLVSLRLELERRLWDLRLERLCWCGCTAQELERTARVAAQVSARLSAGAAQIVLDDIDADRALRGRVIAGARW